MHIEPSLDDVAIRLLSLLPMLVNAHMSSEWRYSMCKRLLMCLIVVAFEVSCFAFESASRMSLWSIGVVVVVLVVSSGSSWR
jgi:hypothetical protein